MIRLFRVFSKKRFTIILTIAFILAGVLNGSNVSVVEANIPFCKDTALGVTAVVNENLPSITISWPKPSIDISNYVVYRKGLNDSSWGSVYEDLNGEDTSFTDTNVVVGVGYEYYISAINSETTTTSYIYSGIKLPATEYRGKVILLFDDAYTSYISNEVNTLVSDMTGDGWQVIRHNIPRTSTPPEIKALIKADYDADPANVKSVFILGHVAIPRSGPIHPDGKNHYSRPFPADCFYGDMVGNWPISNGVYTLTTIPNEIQLEVGRVDVYNMSIAYQNNSLEAAAIKTYLAKDHKYRMKINPAPNTAFIDDYFDNNALYGGNLFRNLSPILDNGYNSVTVGDWTTGLNKTAYSWGCLVGPGDYTSVQNQKVTTDLVIAKNYKVNFIMGLGSYFVEWDSVNNFLRAPLFMKDYGLINMWAGNPNWFIHQMGMGTTFGYGMKTTINNGYSNLYSPPGGSPGGIHVALMGDPTLRLFIIDPPTNQQLEIVSANTNKLTWTASKDSVLGYYIYRADDANSQYTRISDQIVTSTSYIDNAAPSTDVSYMIRAVRLETTGSGSYYNLSQGAFVTSLISSPTSTSVSEGVGYGWAKDTIKKLCTQGIIEGYGDNTIRPEDNISREEFATLAIRALDINVYNTDELNFTDNNTISEWAKPYVSAAVKNNIISGYEDNTFRASANIQRCEIATIAMRALGYNNLVDIETNFSDNSMIPSWAKKYIAKASEIGLVRGYSDGNNFMFKAEDLATRAECFVVIDRMMTAISQ